MVGLPNDNTIVSLITAAGTGQRSDNIVHRTLRAIRLHLGMEVAYISEFAGERTTLLEVDAPGLEGLIQPGDSQSLDDVYCRHILAGRLPQLMPNTAAEPLAAAMSITHRFSIGKHISVPIILPDGGLFGMFCCFGFTADDSLQDRDVQMMKAFADLTAIEINRYHEAKRDAAEKHLRIRNIIEKQQISIIYQPIWDIVRRCPLGAECLARFSTMPSRPPDEWFGEASETGQGTELELAAIRLALAALGAFSADTYLAVNVSPATILSGQLQKALEGIPVERVVLEVTEHTHVADYATLLEQLGPLRRCGLRLAVDDAGAGYSSLRHILQLRPDIIKLDRALTHRIDLDPSRRALASALVRFSEETNSKIIAEGVETYSELNTLRGLGIVAAQGYFLGRPQPLDELVNLYERDLARRTIHPSTLGGSQPSYPT